MEYLSSFEPVADENSKILILGSMPGEESLRKAEYYGHGRNSFWKIIFKILNEEETQDYELKKAVLLKNGIALWDVIRRCRREGSLDSRIRDESVNDFEEFFKAHPQIKYIFFNGKKAYETFRRKVGFEFEGIKFEALSSTSPTNAISFEDRMRDWSKLAAALEHVRRSKNA